MARLARIFSAEIVMALLGMALLPGCTGSSGMAEVSDAKVVGAAQPDKATIVFYRVGSRADTNHALPFDASVDPPHLVGIVNAGMKVAYVSDPGKHRFLVTGANANFMDADAMPGKTYYVEIALDFGLWREGFALQPQRGRDPDVAAKLSALTWFENAPKSQGWVDEHMARVLRQRDAALPKREAKQDWPMLRADDGQ
jgi:hypothetical protein